MHVVYFHCGYLGLKIWVQLTMVISKQNLSTIGHGYLYPKFGYKKNNQAYLFLKFAIL